MPPVYRYKVFFISFLTQLCSLLITGVVHSPRNKFISGLFL
uniref:Uncharacterized protein n=1 Tax=Arundo donax TaxID=35708 RepID=A0A0A9H4A0_ARUDO